MKHVLVYGMTNNPGGIEAYLMGLFRRVHGKTVHFDFVSDFPTVSGGEELRDAGARIHLIPAKSRDLWGHLAGMWRILKEHPEYKTVYFNILDAGAAVTMLPVFALGRKIVVHSHNGSTDKVRLHRLCRPLLKRMTKCRVACSGIAAEFMFGSDSHALVIPNAIDGEKYRFNECLRQQKRQALELSNKPVILHVGRISRQKNPLGLLDIFQAVHRQRPDAVLLSVGSGEMWEEFTAAIAEKGLQSAVKCLGVRGDVAEILQAADVFLLPSLYEGLPISLLEAQAAGLPCVVSDVITREATVTGLVCPVSLEAAPEIWAKNVLEALEQPRRDTLAELTAAGFDISCCEEFDRKLLDFF